MARSVVSVSTEHGSRYLQQLSKHWGHRGEAVFDPQDSRIDFGDGGKVTMQASADALHIQVEVAPEKLKGLEGAVESHIKRFAFREQLDFSWSEAQ